MSHTAQVNLAVQPEHLDCLDMACKALGVELVRGQQHFRYYAGNTEACEHAIRVPGNDRAYEIGLSMHGDARQGYVLRMDSFMGAGGLLDKVGEGCQKLELEYGIAVDMKIKAEEGYEVVRETLEDGRVVVTATMY